MSEDYKRNHEFDDFVGGNQSERHAADEKAKAQEASAEVKTNPYYYYSYDSLKSTIPEEKKQSDDVEEHTVVEVSEPRRTLAAASATSQPVWTPPQQKKRSGFRKGFLTFLAGAVVMAGLMFGADRGNWFSSEPANATTNGASSGNNGAVTSAVDDGSGDGAVKTINLPDTVRPNNIAQIFENASPAVVKIETFAKPSALRGGNPFFDVPMFREFFGDQFGNNNGNQQGDDGLQAMGMGSGFFFQKDGYILTNQHVIAGAEKIQVSVQGYDEPLEAELLGNDFNLDLAVLKVEGDNFPFLQLGNVDDLNIGDWVVAIGNPYGFDHTVTVGVLSAKERPINIPDQQEGQTRQYKHLLQTDAAINSGNSGGPLLNLNGEVIGINTAVSTQAQGIGFAIPTSTITDVLNSLKNNVKIPKPYIGIYMADIQESWLKELGLDSTDGVIIRSTIDGSPAEMAGIQPYDVVLEIDGEKVKNMEDLAEKIKAKQIGDRIELKISRDGTKINTALKIGDQNE